MRAYLHLVLAHHPQWRASQCTDSQTNKETIREIRNFKIFDTIAEVYTLTLDGFFSFHLVKEKIITARTARKHKK